MVGIIHTPRTTFGDTISYMERKCAMGSGVLLDKGIEEDKPSKYWKELKDTANLNPNVKNKCLHISLNLPPEENIDKDKFIDIGKNYMEKMGYSDCPYLMYAHNDKDHSHIHIILSSVDYNGTWVDDSFSHNRSYTICRNLEAEYNLTPLQVSNLSTKHYSMSEKTLLEYSFRNGLRRAFYDKKAFPILDHFINSEEKELLIKWNSNNAICTAVLGEERFKTINDFLIEKGYCTKHIKGELLKVIDEAYKFSTKDEYFKYLENNNISINVFSRQGKTGYSYKHNDYDYKFSENSLPKNFSYKALNEKYGNFKGSYIPQAEQKHLLYNVIRSNVQFSDSFMEFLTNCHKSNVNCEVIPTENGPKIEFTLKGVDNPVTLKGEEVFSKFSFESLSTHFTASTIEPLYTTSISDIAFTAENIATPEPIFIGSGSPKHSRDDEDATSLRRKKKKRRGPSMER